MMAFAVITLSAAAQKSGFDVKAGFGLSSYMGDAADGAAAKFNWLRDSYQQAYRHRAIFDA